MFWLMRRLQAKAHDDFSLVGLKAAIIVIALALLVLALTVNNKWVLAGVLVYELLP